MTHVVVGAPDLRKSEQIVAALAAGGSDFVELQIPHSDPVADGPVIAGANYAAVESGVGMQDYFRFAEKVTQKFPETKFICMTYLNKILTLGIPKFTTQLKRAGIWGVIVPDLPLEESVELLSELFKKSIQLIFVVSPNTSDTRLKQICQQSDELIYCTARMGVTGGKTDFSIELGQFLTRIKKFTQLPLAVGFGVKSAADTKKIRAAGGQVAVVGSELIRRHEKGGTKEVKKFVEMLKKA